jgi:hypothetical protein
MPCNRAISSSWVGHDLVPLLPAGLHARRQFHRDGQAIDAGASCDELGLVRRGRFAQWCLVGIGIGVCMGELTLGAIHGGSVLPRGAGNGQFGPGFFGRGLF